MRRAWDDDERKRDDKGKKSPDDNNDEERMIQVHELDLYEQDLLEIKRLVNERNKAPANRHAIYNRAINKIIDGLEEYGMETDYPYATFKQDVASALQGGKYRKIYKNPENDNENDIIDMGRKKKLSKPKPKRKPVKKVVKKVIKKCKCK